MIKLTKRTTTYTKNSSTCKVLKASKKLSKSKRPLETKITYSSLWSFVSMETSNNGSIKEKIREYCQKMRCAKFSLRHAKQYYAFTQKGSYIEISNALTSLSRV